MKAQEGGAVSREPRVVTASAGTVKGFEIRVGLLEGVVAVVGEGGGEHVVSHEGLRGEDVTP